MLKSLQLFGVSNQLESNFEDCERNELTALAGNHLRFARKLVYR